MRIDHLNIVVGDVERSARFYSEYLGLRRGFETVLEGEWVERVTGLAGARAHCLFMETEEGGPRLELLQYLAPKGEALEATRRANTAGLRHVAFNLESPAHLTELEHRLRAGGVPVISEPVAVPFRVGKLGCKHLFYFLDPDGVIVEAAAYEPASE